MQSQEELFNQIKRLAIKVDTLKGFVQNDLDRMIADGTITSKDIDDAICAAESDFDKVILELQKTKKEVKKFIELVIHRCGLL